MIHISLRFILLLSFLLCLRLSSDLFPVALPAEILKAFMPSSILGTRAAHLNLLVLITLTIFGEQYKQRSSSLWSLLHSPFSSLLGPNICLRILFSNILSLRSSLNVRDHASQSYNTTGKIVLYLHLLAVESGQRPRRPT